MADFVQVWGPPFYVKAESTFFIVLLEGTECESEYELEYESKDGYRQ
jgi:hypothetical protein